MAALSISAANVRPIGATSIERVLAGEAITQGQPVFPQDSNGQWIKSDANDSTKQKVTGVAMSPASASGDPLIIAKQVGGSINIGATTVKGAMYYVGATAGELVPLADLTTGDAVLPVLQARDTSGNCDLVLLDPEELTIL